MHTLLLRRLRPFSPAKATWHLPPASVGSHGQFRCRGYHGGGSVVIVGGGVIGSSVAYFIAQALRVRGYTLAPGRPDSTGEEAQWTVTLIERDPSYRFSSTTRSVGGIRHQFSTPENIMIGHYGTQFLHSAHRLLSTSDANQGFWEVDIQFKEHGYLFLASPDGRPVIEANHRLQRKLGSNIDLLASSEEIKARFPYLNTEGLSAGCVGVTGEGWFDPAALLHGFRRKAISMGVNFVHGEVVGTELTRKGRQFVEAVHVNVGGSINRIACTHLVNAMGPQAARLSRMMGLTLPVIPRKRCVFVIQCRDEQLKRAKMPLLIDPSGVYCRPEGSGQFITGVSPTVDPDVSDDFDVEHSLFEEVIWPTIAHRVPSFEAIKVVGAWAGHYDFNTFDQNAILGTHPDVPNYYHANGFSGHGLQQAPAVGRSVAELMLEGRYQTLDLSVFNYTRFLENKPVVEKNVV